MSHEKRVIRTLDMVADLQKQISELRMRIKEIENGQAKKDEQSEVSKELPAWSESTP